MSVVNACEICNSKIIYKKMKRKKYKGHELWCGDEKCLKLKRLVYNFLIFLESYSMWQEENGLNYKKTIYLQAQLKKLAKMSMYSKI